MFLQLLYVKGKDSQRAVLISFVAFQLSNSYFLYFAFSGRSEDLSGVHCSASEKPFSGLSGKGKVKANEGSGK